MAPVNHAGVAKRASPRAGRPGHRLNVVHLIRPQPRGSVGGSDMHVVDLATVQQAGGDVRPRIVELGSTGYAEWARGRDLDVVSVPQAFTPAGARRLLAALEGAHILHTHGYEPDYVGAVLRIGSRRRRLVTTTHGFIRISTVLRLKTDLDHQCLKVADAVIASSRPEADRLGRYLGRSVAYIPNGVFGAVAAGVVPGEDRSVPVIGFVGRLSPEKRPDHAIRVLARLDGDLAGARLRLFGGGPERGRLASLARHLGVAGRVEFCGVVRDLDELYRSIDVLLLLSESEGTPRVILEAMARRVPVVATPVGGVPELLGGGAGRLVAGDDLAAAAAAVSEVLTEPGVRDQLAMRGRSRWEREFTAPLMGSRVLQVYQAVVSEGRRTYDPRRYWSAVGERLATSPATAGEVVLAGDTTPFYRAKRAEVARRVEEAAAGGGGRFLEVGCGNGLNLRLLAEGRVGAATVGVDASAPMLALASQASPGVALVQADGTRLPFCDRAFEVALSVTVLQHNSDVAAGAIVAELCRVADRVHLFEDLALVGVRDRPSHVLRTLGHYQRLFAGQEFTLVASEPLETPVSELLAVVARWVLTAGGRQEGGAAPRRLVRFEERVLPFTLRVDAWMPKLAGIWALTFERTMAEIDDGLSEP